MRSVSDGGSAACFGATAPSPAGAASASEKSWPLWTPSGTLTLMPSGRVTIVPGGPGATTQGTVCSVPSSAV